MRNLFSGTVPLRETAQLRFGVQRAVWLAVVCCLPALGQYQVSPGTIWINAVVGAAAPAPVSVTVSRLGAGAAVIYGAAPDQPWLSHNAGGGFSMAPVDAELSRGAFQVFVNTAGLSSGQRIATFELRSAPSGGTVVGKVLVILTVGPPPSLSVSPAVVTFGMFAGDPPPPAQTVTVSGFELGSDYIFFTATATQPYVKITGAPGFFVSGGSGSFTVAFDPTKVPPGTTGPFLDTITVTGSNGLVRTVDFAAAFLTGEVTPVTVTPSVIPISLKQGEKGLAVVSVAMRSDTTISIEPSASTPWVTVSPNVMVGSFTELRTTAVRVNIDATGLSAGSGPRTAIVALRRTAGVVIGDVSFRVELTVTPADELQVDKEAVTFSGTAGAGQASPASQTIQVRNVGPDVTYYVSSGARWIVVSKPQGAIGADGSDTFSVAIDASQLPAGTSSGTVVVSAAGRAERTVKVTAQMAAAVTDLTVSSEALNFSGTVGSGSSSPTSLSVSVKNTGPAVSYVVSASDGWIKVSKASGTLGPDGQDSFSVSADVVGLGVGTRAGTITVSAAGRPSRVIPVTLQLKALEVTPPPIVEPVDLTVSETLLSFGAGARSVVVQNSGPAVAYAVTASAAWIQVSKSGGNLAANGTDSFTVSVSGPAPESALSGTVTVSASGRPARSVAVRYEAKVAATATLGVWPAELTFYADAGQAAPPQIVTLTAGSKETVRVSAASASNWLQAEGTVQTPAAVAVRVNASTVARPAVGQIDLAPASGAVASATVPVTLRALGAPVYSIPRVADGDGYTTSITLVNVDTTAATVSLTFRKEDGQGNTTPWTPLMEGDAPLTEVLIAPGGQKTWQTRGLGSAGENGWAAVTSNRRISGFAVFRRTGQEVAVALNSGWQQRFLLPFDNVGSVTAVALSNVSGTEAASISATFRDERGEVLPGGYERVLPAMGHVAFGLSGLQGRRGTAEFVATGGRLSAAGLRFSGTSGAVTSFEPQSLNSSASGALSIPQIADGVFSDESGRFATSITVVNNDVTAALVTLRFYRQNAADTATQPWTPAMEGGAGLENVAIPAGSSYTWRTAGKDALSVGWAEVLSGQRVSGFAVFRQTVEGRGEQEAAVPINAGAAGRFVVPFDQAGFVTTLALANMGGEAAAIDVTFRDEQQRVLATDRLSLAAKGHDAFALTRYGALDGRRGTAEFRVRTGQVSALGLRFAGEAFTSFRPQALPD